jgi:tetratricopeptide (TPR) repeat protein
MPRGPGQPPLVFISYSHADKRWLAKLRPFLKQLERHGKLEAWADTSLPTGSSWYEELGERMRNARAAILLVTQNFLASDFCSREEVPVLLQQSRRGRLTLFPVLLDHCNYEAERWLKRIQMRTWDGAPIRTARQNYTSAFTSLAQELERAVMPDYVPPDARVLERWSAPGFDLSRLPETGSLLFGRERELSLLDQAWEETTRNIAVLEAGGGTGKSTVARVFCETLAEEHWRGAERAFAWSFYSQGAGRMNSAEEFIEEAFTFFGGTVPRDRPLSEQGERLADLVRRRKTLLVLDGIEPLQSRSVADRGSLQDVAVRALIETLAEFNHGLCLITTREPLVDLIPWRSSVVHQTLDQVDALAGRALLRVQGVRGDDREVERRVEEVNGSALALTLLGRAIADTPHRHVASVTLPSRTAGEEDASTRVMDLWAHRLGDGAPLELLHLIGLFDRPASTRALQAVIDAGPLPGVSRHLTRADDENVLQRLVQTGLLAEASNTPRNSVDAHPLVREYFGGRLRDAYPDTFAEAHRRLYEYYAASAPRIPDTLHEMKPLFEAIRHGCAAGLHQEACDEIFYTRVNRRTEDYLAQTLGAAAAALTCASHFFVTPWSETASALSEEDQTWLIAQSGGYLHALGRLTEAIEPIRLGLDRSIQARNWRNAGATAALLSRLEHVLGALVDAEWLGDRAVEFADAADSPSVAIQSLVVHAISLMQLGEFERARARFEQAERLQAHFSEHELLGDEPGYWFGELLLALNEPEEAFRRASRTLELSTREGAPGPFDRLSLCRAEVALNRATPETAARTDQALDQLHHNGHPQDVVTGLLARAWCSSAQGNFARAHTDLREAEKIIRRSALWLLAGDLQLEYARMFHAAGNAYLANVYRRYATSRGKTIRNELLLFKLRALFGEIEDLDEDDDDDDDDDDDQS